MNLNYELPAWAEEKLPPVSEEKRYYSVPYDIGADGAWLSDSYLVVTQKKIYLLSEGSPAQCFALTDCEEAAAEANVGCGLLTIRYRGEKRFLVQYSGKHLARYAYIARGIRILCSGRTERWKVRSMRKSVRIVDERSRGQNIVRIVRKKEAFGIPFWRWQHRITGNFWELLC